MLRLSNRLRNFRKTYSWAHRPFADSFDKTYHEDQNNLEDSEVTCMMLHPVCWPK